MTARKKAPLLALPDPAPPEPAGDVAKVDLIIERPDLGFPPEWGTFIQKGDRIPPELADFPRRPA